MQVHTFKNKIGIQVLVHLARKYIKEKLGLAYKNEIKTSQFYRTKQIHLKALF